MTHLFMYLTGLILGFLFGYRLARIRIINITKENFVKNLSNLKAGEEIKKHSMVYLKNNKLYNIRKDNYKE